MVSTDHFRHELRPVGSSLAKRSDRYPRQFWGTLSYHSAGHRLVECLLRCHASGVQAGRYDGSRPNQWSRDDRPVSPATDYRHSNQTAVQFKLGHSRMTLLGLNGRHR
jgi:hypothetical protein